ncbi:MAG: hypothetical protein ACP5JV_07805 [Thermus sp.]
MLALAGETLVDLVLEGENPLRFAGALGGSVLAGKASGPLPGRTWRRP